jgi:hypothetical protein
MFTTFFGRERSAIQHHQVKLDGGVITQVSKK